MSRLATRRLCNAGRFVPCQLVSCTAPALESASAPAQAGGHIRRQWPANHCSPQPGGARAKRTGRNGTRASRHLDGSGAAPGQLEPRRHAAQRPASPLRRRIAHSRPCTPWLFCRPADHPRPRVVGASANLSAQSRCAVGRSSSLHIRRHALTAAVGPRYCAASPAPYGEASRLPHALRRSVPARIRRLILSVTSPSARHHSPTFTHSTISNHSATPPSLRHRRRPPRSSRAGHSVGSHPTQPHPRVLCPPGQMNLHPRLDPPPPDAPYCMQQGPLR